MTHGYCETTSYLRHGDVPEAAASLAALLEAEGMRRVARPPQAPCHVRALQANLWSVVVYPGSAGWSVVRSVPSDLLAERAAGSGRSRLAQLAAALGAAAFQVNVADGEPWGEVVLEVGADGAERGSGWWSLDGSSDEEEGEPGTRYYGLALEGSGKVQPGGAELQALHEQSRDPALCEYRGDSEFEIFCHYLSGRLGGPNGFAPVDRSLLRGPPVSCAGGVLMFFEWPAADRPWPQLSEEGRIRAELFRQPRFFYADGSPVQLGDAVLVGDACLPAQVAAFGALLPGTENRVMRNAETRGRRDFQPSHVHVDDGTEEPPAAVPIAQVAAQLRLAERDSADFARAGLRWIVQAASGGDTMAQCALGGHYLRGRYLARDEAQAAKWLERAAARGHAGAQYRLGRLCLGRDPEQALRWWRQAANGGSADARFALAVRHESGEGVPQDYAQAAAWYRKLAEQGYRRAQCRLGYLHERGLGVTQDHAQARRCYLEAADEVDRTPGRIRRGLPEAQYRLGLLCLRGLGMQAADSRQAFAWLKQAADGGHDGARLELARMYEQGEGVEKNAGYAQSWRAAVGQKPQPAPDELFPDGPAPPLLGQVRW